MTRFLPLAALLLPALGLTAQPDVIEGPCAIGSFFLAPDPDEDAALAPEARSWTLDFSDLPMPFAVRPVPAEDGRPPAAPDAWTVARPDGSAAATYALRRGKLRLVDGPGAHRYWLFDPGAVAEQREGVPVPAGLPQVTIADLYATLLVNSFTKGTQPLFTMSLLRADLPGPFRLIGLPAFEADAATALAGLYRHAVRKIEGDPASGTFAVVAPDRGLTLATASGWVALASGVTDAAEGYAYDGPLPYGYRCGDPWARFGLPRYWVELQTQNAGPSGTHYIYTTPMLPGLALLATRSADSATLVGMTLLHQPYMAGSTPPSLLPPYAPDSAWRRHAVALQANASLDWILLTEGARQRRALSPPGTSPIDTSALSATVTAVAGARGFALDACPGSDSPVQPRCADALARRLAGWLGDAYAVETRFRDAAGAPLEALDERAVDEAGWLLVHRDDAGRAPVDRTHPIWEVLLRRERPSAEGAPATGGARADRGGFATGWRAELWVLPPEADR